MRKLKLLGIVAVLGVYMLFAMGSGSESEDGNITNVSESENTDSSDENSSEEETKDNVVKKGGSYENDGLKFTVKKIDTNFKVKDDEFGLYEPKKGKKYIAVTFKFENNGDSDKYVSLYDFECYADNEPANQEFISTEEDNEFVNENLSPGRNVTFTAYYSVSKKAKSIQLEYTPDFWSNEKIIVQVK